MPVIHITLFIIPVPTQDVTFHPFSENKFDHDQKFNSLLYTLQPRGLVQLRGEVHAQTSANLGPALLAAKRDEREDAVLVLELAVGPRMS